MRIHPGRAGATDLAEETRDDERLSVTALGLLDVLLAAARHGRSLTMEVLARHRGPSREQLVDATRDLIATGYVARVKHHTRGRWGTDLYAFATPATREELAALREHYPDAVSVTVEPDAPSEPAAGTTPFTTRARAATGAGGRSAASTTTPDGEPADTRTVRAVLAQLPGPLAGLLPQHLPASVLEAARRELAAGRTPEQLVERIQRRWELHGYAGKAAAGALTSPLGVAVALVRHGECPDPMCEDGVRVDSGETCPRCAERREEHRARRAAAAPADRPGPGAPSAAPAARPTPTPPPFASLQLGTSQPDPATTRAGLGRVRAALAASKSKITSPHGSRSAR
ncbi:hypothetical protein ACFY4B_26505 [Kitasatospora sp. NPDC001261]|uniref:hypothetical protein n=1 Tax=Kitasatospora sp. NPDC001261 TaxID=3364012 RepID=UPI0036BCA513